MCLEQEKELAAEVRDLGRDELVRQVDIQDVLEEREALAAEVLEADLAAAEVPEEAIVAAEDVQFDLRAAACLKLLFYS